MRKLLFFTSLIITLFNLNFVYAQRYDLKVNSNKLFQGDTLIFRLPLNNNLKIKNIYFLGQSINFIEINNTIMGFIGIDAKQKPGKYNLVIIFDNNHKIEEIISIQKRNFPITQLEITPELENKGFTVSRIINNLNTENEIIKNKVSKFTNKIYFKDEFIYPLNKINIVGNYGNIRKNKKNEVQHLGVDLDGRIGDPIYAINNGRIVLVKDLLNYGKTIVIDHGAGIFSLYLHLSKSDVKENDIVLKGQKIGEVGNSGYSIDPHLHFSIKINNTSVDPLKFIDSLNDFIKNSLQLIESNKNKTELSIFDLSANVNWGFSKTQTRKIDTIIIHSSYNPLDNDYYNLKKIINIYKNYGVSSHYIIDKQGNIYNLIDEKNIAYHAGESKMPDGRTGVNQFSIGIELIYNRNGSPNDKQYESLNKLIENIKSRYNIKYILGHKDVAPNRKDDPWNFNWEKIYGR
ncbi:MAG: hypothetical protein KatS3mg095_0868 [Candidatus Parcubacteria bacterium]|nr:MAG: hypothetical protein KatS3mg095_0868 [Candidatus Parcubacteria bacterium]